MAVSSGCMVELGEGCTNIFKGTATMKTSAGEREMDNQGRECKRLKAGN